jgi:hypothetical protein
VVSTPASVIDSDTPNTSPNRHRWLWPGVVVIVLLTAGGWWLFNRTQASGDPGGKVLNQLVPAASALPGYGTSSLPWVSNPSLTQAYLIKSEPKQDSCDGRPGTEGWGQAVVQAGIAWAGTTVELISQVGDRLAALGWHRLSTSTTGSGGVSWAKQLSNGSTASASLDPEQGTDWEFVAIAPPVGKAASGC